MSTMLTAMQGSNERWPPPFPLDLSIDSTPRCAPRYTDTGPTSPSSLSEVPKLPGEASGKASGLHNDRPGAGIMEADHRQVTTVFTVQGPVSWRPTTVK